MDLFCRILITFLQHSKILVTVSQRGHQRCFQVAPHTSVITPIATKMVRRDERRRGPRLCEKCFVSARILGAMSVLRSRNADRRRIGFLTAG